MIFWYLNSLHAGDTKFILSECRRLEASGMELHGSTEFVEDILDAFRIVAKDPVVRIRSACVFRLEKKSKVDLLKNSVSTKFRR